jgi:3-hydroxyisobutyrate dehydrogenase-like beta-hydroxyacid dehydrogenase
MNNSRQPAEPKPELVLCALAELLAIAQVQGITPADFMQLLDSGMHISDFLAAMSPRANAKNSIDAILMH